MERSFMVGTDGRRHGIDETGEVQPDGFHAPRHLGLLCASLACAMGLGLAAMLRQHTWDDSAITLGYARTLAQTGEVSFGRFGERVEGTSSFLWMLVCTLCARFVSTPDGLLAGARVMCAALYLINGWLLYALARVALRTNHGAAAVCCLFALSTVSVASVADGMENHLFLLLHLALMRSSAAWVAEGGTARRAIIAAACLTPLVLCRPEGWMSFLVWAGVMGRFAIHGTQATLRAWLIAVSAAAVAGLSFLIWRHGYFGLWAPNTVYAKLWPPYLKHGIPRCVSALRAVIVFGLVAFAWMVPCVVGFPVGRLVAACKQVVREAPVPTAWVAAYVLFHLYTGQQMGTHNRTLLCVIPFAFLMGAMMLQRLSVRISTLRVLAAGAVFLGIQAAFAWRYQSNAITVERVRSLVSPGMEFALRFGGSPPCVATPDAGASVLYWGDRVRLIDTALLNHPQAARAGWAAMAQVLEGTALPDAIETHRPWTKLSGFDRHPVVLSSYVKVSLNERFFLVHSEALHRAMQEAPPDLRIVEAERLSREDRLRILDRQFTDFRGDDTDVPLPWMYAVSWPESR